MRVKASPLFEIALVLVRLEHFANRIVNADHSIMWPAVKLRVVYCPEIENGISAGNRARLRQPTWECPWDGHFHV